MPQSMREGMLSKPPQEQGSWFRARIANAVGTTQLTVSGNHGQPILVGVETNVAIGGAKLPFPEPIRFLAGTVQQPVEPLQPRGYCRHHITKSHYSQRSDPATLLIVSREDWPTSIRVLGVEQKVLSTFDVAHRHRAEGERGVARRLNCWLRGRCKRSPTSTRELP